MSGSNIFLIYQDGSGNVTSSCRQGEFHQEPPFNTASDAAKLTVLAGSGVSADGKTFLANIACSNCNSWFNGGQMSFTDSKAPWIAAWKSGSSLATTDKAADISQHDDTSQFRLDLTKAVTVSDSNPFVSGSTSGSSSSSGSGGNSGSSSSSSPGSSPSGSTGGSSSGSSGDSSSGVVQLGGDDTVNNALPVAHGLIMSLAIVVLFPVGAMLMPLFGRWYIHAAWQLFAWLLMWAAFGIAVVSSKQLGIVSHALVSLPQMFQLADDAHIAVQRGHRLSYDHRPNCRCWTEFAAICWLPSTSSFPEVSQSQYLGLGTYLVGPSIPLARCHQRRPRLVAGWGEQRSHNRLLGHCWGFLAAVRHCNCVQDCPAWAKRRSTAKT
jgi:hypothetical protein